MRQQSCAAAAAALFLCLAAAPAFAGPDWAAIERARALKQAQKSQCSTSLASKAAPLPGGPRASGVSVAATCSLKGKGRGDAIPG